MKIIEIKKWNFVIIMIFLLNLNLLFSQTSINTTGNDTKGINGSVSYSVGQIGFTTHFGTIGTEAQGVQQPYEISVVLDVEQIDHKSINLSVFPNPTSNLLMLSIDSLEFSKMKYQLYDLSGKLLDNKIITNTIEKIYLGHLPNATYFLKVIMDENIIESFKIIKRN